MSTRAMAMATVPVVALIGTILLIGAFGGWEQRPGSPLRGVSADNFAQLSIVPAEAGAAPAISKAAAIEIAHDHPEPGEVRQALLARDTFRGNTLVWVVSFDPTTVIAYLPLGGCYTSQPPEIQVIYSLMVIDAETGDVMGRMGQSRFLTEPDCDESRWPTVPD